MPAKHVTFNNTRVGHWVCSRIGGDPDKLSQSIGLVENQELIAGVMFDRFNGSSVCMHVAAVPGARWMTRRFLWMCFDYPFNQMRVKKILGLVDSTNTKSCKFQEHLGFTLECNIEDAGRSGDLLIYSMTRQQCRFIEGKYGRQIISSPGT